jgi:hypothetical protein
MQCLLWLRLARLSELINLYVVLLLFLLLDVDLCSSGGLVPVLLLPAVVTGEPGSVPETIVLVLFLRTYLQLLQP